MRKQHNIGRPKVEINEALCKRLREIRGDKTRQEFIDELHITKANSDELMTPEQFKLYEYGKRNVPEHIRRLISEYFNLSESDFQELPSEEDICKWNRQREIEAEICSDLVTHSFIQYLKSMFTIEYSEENVIVIEKNERYYLSYKKLHELETRTQKLTREFIMGNSSK